MKNTAAVTECFAHGPPLGAYVTAAVFAFQENGGKLMYIIQNGTLVSAEKSWRADLSIEGGKIAAIAPALSPAPGDQVLDASGCLVFPGFIDPHTHLDMDNGVTVTADDFSSGTLAAVCGGTTTVIDFATQDRGNSLSQALELWHKKADGLSSCNYAFHMAVTDWNEATRQELRDMAAAGVTSLKVYLAYDALRIHDGQLLDILQECRALGLQIGCHCENGDVVNFLQRQELARGNFGPSCFSPNLWPPDCCRRRGCAPCWPKTPPGSMGCSPKRASWPRAPTPM